MHLERNLEVQWGFERQRNGGKGLQAEYLACSKAGTWGAGPTVVGCVCVAAAAVQHAEGRTSLLGWLLASTADFVRWAFRRQHQFLGWLYFCGPAPPSRRWSEDPRQAGPRGW